MASPALKLKVFVGFPSYGGNGGISSEVPCIREWWLETALKMKGDPRIAGLYTHTVADTPITMVRNDFVRMAIDTGCHLLMMVDSDQSPNKHAGESWFKPFWDEAFNFIYDNYQQGPRLVFAPYCGPSENVYCFKWEDHSSSKYIDSSFELAPYSRQEAAKMSGIHECAAGPTGLILIDLRLCDLIKPSGLPKRTVLENLQTGKIDVDQAIIDLHEGYFHYEWETSYANKKASTEDVTFTRNVSLAGIERLGYNPVFCAWDSWIGHHKPVNVGRPTRFTADHVHETLRRAAKENERDNEVIVDLARLPGIPAALRRMSVPPPGYFDRQHNGNGHANGQKKPELKKHWLPLASAMTKVQQALEGKKLIVDVGPGNLPMKAATHFVGKRAPKTEYPGPIYEIDLDKDRLPFEDGEVDFLFCRHTIEDLQNPEHLLSEIRRVAKAGYIETPSPMAEATHGVNSPGTNAPGRGYPHHRSIVWSIGGDVLYVLPKMPVWDSLPFPDYTEQLQTPELWNAYHFWEGPLEYRILANDKDYLLGVDDRYQRIALAAVDSSRRETMRLFAEQPADQTTTTGRVTTGPWHAHGHAPKEHRDALADLVRGEGYRKVRELRILEVGSWLGATAMAMADASTFARVHCVDHWSGSPGDLTLRMVEAAGGSDAVYDEFLKRIGSRLDKTIFPWRMSSAEAAAKHWEPFDIIFIDAEHTYEALKAQILEWWPHLRDDGIMCGHDFAVHQYEGVGQAVEELFGNKFDTFGWHPQGCMWRVRKQDHLENAHVGVGEALEA